MNTSQFSYVTYISSTPKKVWSALLDPATTAKYWQHENVSNWKPGSKWEHRRSNHTRAVDLVGKVVEYSLPRRLVLTWAFPADEARKNKHSRVTLDVKPFRGIARLSVTHDRIEPGSDMLEGITDGWPKVLASPKSLLETRAPLPKLW